MNDRNFSMPGLVQSFLDDRGADGVLVDDENGEVAVCHVAIMMQRSNFRNKIAYFLDRIIIAYFLIRPRIAFEPVRT
ncbi:hypothetical protein D9M72_553490 [compost metagenome]